MKRKDFLKGLGISSIGSLLPINNSSAGPSDPTSGSACTLIPSETEGPFPLDLTANNTFFRKDIKETKTGVPFNVKIKVIGSTNCLPMRNVRVNIWHCDKDGLYSGYSANNNQGQAGLTYCRGFQITDSNGEVEFTTIFPGWYSGRITHIHFQVYVSSTYAAISQMTWDVAAKNAIYTGNATLYTKGVDPMTLTSDNIFSDGYALQLATLTKNAITGGYDTYLEVTVQGSGTTKLGNIEKENAKNFNLGQNFPNPYVHKTTIPFSLLFPSDVKLHVFDLAGKKIFEKPNRGLNPGNHQMEFNAQNLGLPSSTYAYQLDIKNKNGLYTDTKLMTAR